MIVEFIQKIGLGFKIYVDMDEFPLNNKFV